MATPIGPWIAPTLVIVGSVLLKLGMIRYRDTELAYAVAGGSIGGILATACGFSFPTLYFLAPEIFTSWLAHPWYFGSILAFLCISAGLFGYVCACLFEKSFIYEQQLSFPIGQLVYSMLTAHDHVQNQRRLIAGFSMATLVSWLQGGLLRIPSLLPRSLFLLPTMHIGAWRLESISLRLDMLPMLLAIGFIAGHLITIPLIVGALSKIIILDTVQRWFFSHASNADFMLAFCSGIVLIGALQSFTDLPRMAKQFWQRYAQKKSIHSSSWIKDIFQVLNMVEVGIIAVAIFGFLTFMQFPILEQFFLIVATFLTTYQITMIAGKIGMAQLGRFATFVMIPGLILFGIDPIHATITASFVEISGGVATDILFGKKMGYLMHMPSLQLKRFQLFGLCIASISIGVIFWILITHFGLGSEKLFAQRAQARALLINARNFDLLVLGLGMIYGFILKRIKVNPLLVLGGLLMPINYSIGLMIGGVLPIFVADSKSWEPFWSGMFAANSIWELIKIVF